MTAEEIADITCLQIEEVQKILNDITSDKKNSQRRSGSFFCYISKFRSFQPNISVNLFFKKTIFFQRSANE